MAKFILLGEYNQQYKYILIYLILRFTLIFTFSNNFVFEQLRVEIIGNLPYGPFIYLQFNYLTYIIISIIIIIFRKCFQKKDKDKEIIDEQLIFNKRDIVLEYGVKKSDYFLFIIICFAVITDVFYETTYQFKCGGMFEYWMFEMLFYEIFHSRLFNTKIYAHHIYSLIFILSSCSLIQSIETIIKFVKGTSSATFFDNKKWLIPVSLIIYFLFHVFRVYTFSREKYYLEKRFISIPNYILFLGIFGLIISSIGALASNYVPCGDENNISELSKTVCWFKENNQTYYFDNYNKFFENLYSEQFSLKLILLIIRYVLNCIITYSIYAIFKNLSPIYYICSMRFNIFIILILDFFNYLINDDINNISTSIYVCYFLILLFYLIGAIIYLEIIELNFCKLNFYTKRNIKARSTVDLSIALADVSSDNSERSFEEILE